MEYFVEQKENYVEIYAIYYEKRKSKYSSFEDLMNNYMVYNEPLITLLDRKVILR